MYLIPSFYTMFLCSAGGGGGRGAKERHAKNSLANFVDQFLHLFKKVACVLRPTHQHSFAGVLLGAQPSFMFSNIVEDFIYIHLHAFVIYRWFAASMFPC